MSGRNFILAALLLPAAGRAGAQPAAGAYVNLGAGAGFLQSAVLKPAMGGAERASLSFSPGVALEAGAGFGIGGGLRLELGGDFASGRIRGGKAGGAGDLYGGFFNALYDFSTGTGFVPYLGIGAGYQLLDLDAGGAETGSAFGYQGIAGLSYPVGTVPGLSLTAEYRLVAMLSPPAYDRGTGGGFAGGTAVSNIFDHQALLGLRYAFGKPPPRSLPDAPMPPQAAPSEPATRTYLVFFDWDRADLSARARQIVAQAASASTRVPNTRIEVSGYTDASGTRTYNQSLSLRRAQTVEAELVRDGVPAAEIAVRGLGERNPLVPTAAGVRAPQNRRVEIVLR